MALAGAAVGLESVKRGQALVSEPAWPPTSMLTVDLTVLAGTGWRLKHGQRVRVHLGTSEVMARVVTLEGPEVKPGSSGWVQLRLEKPLLARARDRLVVRSYSPLTTIGGGVVAEALAPKRKRLGAGEAEALGALIGAPGPDALASLLDLASWSGAAVGRIPVDTGLSPSEADQARPPRSRRAPGRPRARSGDRGRSRRPGASSRRPSTAFTRASRSGPASRLSSCARRFPWTRRRAWPISC